MYSDIFVKGGQRFESRLGKFTVNLLFRILFHAYRTGASQYCTISYCNLKITFIELSMRLYIDNIVWTLVTMVEQGEQVV